MIREPRVENSGIFKRPGFCLRSGLLRCGLNSCEFSYGALIAMLDLRSSILVTSGAGDGLFHRLGDPLRPGGIRMHAVGKLVTVILQHGVEIDQRQFGAPGDLFHGGHNLVTDDIFANAEGILVNGRRSTQEDLRLLGRFAEVLDERLEIDGIQLRTMPVCGLLSFVPSLITTMCGLNSVTSL